MGEAREVAGKVGVGEARGVAGVSKGVGETRGVAGKVGVGEVRAVPGGVSKGVGDGEISDPVVSGEVVGEGETRGVAPGLKVAVGEPCGVARGVSKGVGDGDSSAPVVGVGDNGGSPVFASLVGFGEGESELEFGWGRVSWGFWTSGTGTKKNAIAANAKLDSPNAAGAALFAIGSSGLAYRRDIGARDTDISGKVCESAKN